MLDNTLGPPPDVLRYVIVALEVTIEIMIQGIRLTLGESRSRDVRLNSEDATSRRDIVCFCSRRRAFPLTASRK